MEAVIIGGGASGRAIARACAAHGIRARLASRSTGFDAAHDDAVPALSGAQVVIDATSIVTARASEAIDFFSRTAGRIGAATKKLGAHYIVLSIVNCDAPGARDYGYYAGKIAQERAAQDTGGALTIVRTTQWHEFPGQVLERLRTGPFCLVPSMRIQPIALDAVADLIAERCLRGPSGALVQACGPEPMTLWEMTGHIPRPGVTRVPLIIPTAYGRAFRDGTLIPGQDVPRIGPAFEDWLKGRAA